MKTFKRETFLKLITYFLTFFLGFFMFLLCQSRQSPKLFKSVQGTEARIFNQTIYDIYNFTGIEHPRLWKNGDYSSLYDLTSADLKSFFQYKELQYQNRSTHIAKQCKFIQALANHTSQKSNYCGIKNGKCFFKL